MCESVCYQQHLLEVNWLARRSKPKSGDGVGRLLLIMKNGIFEQREDTRYIHINSTATQLHLIVNEKLSFIQCLPQSCTHSTHITGDTLPIAVCNSRDCATRRRTAFLWIGLIVRDECGSLQTETIRDLWSKPLVCLAFAFRARRLQIGNYHGGGNFEPVKGL